MKFQDKKRNGFEAKDPSFMGSDGVYKKIDVSLLSLILMGFVATHHSHNSCNITCPKCP